MSKDEALLQDFTLEQKRAMAAEHRGVTYDRRIDRYTSVVMVAGERRWLGSFRTVEGASAAYQSVRRDNPVRRSGGVPSDPERWTMPKCYADFHENCAKDQYGHPAVGELFVTPDDQVFEVVGKNYFKKREGGPKRNWLFLRWTSECAVCGVSYHTRTLARARTLSGITRTCDAHRGQRKDADAGTEVRPATPRVRAEAQIVARIGDAVAADPMCRPFDPADRLCASMIDDLGETEARRRWQLMLDKQRGGADLV